MFITRASRHDKADLQEFLAAHGEEDANVDEGVAFVAREGGIIGSVKLVEVAPQTVVVTDVMVKEDRRRQGIGSAVMKAAMNSRGGTLYLCTHDETRAFYRTFGFEDVDIDEAPTEVVDYWRAVGDYPTEEGHQHFFMRAR